MAMPKKPCRQTCQSHLEKMSTYEWWWTATMLETNGSDNPGPAFLFFATWTLSIGYPRSNQKLKHQSLVPSLLLWSTALRNFGDWDTRLEWWVFPVWTLIRLWRQQVCLALTYLTLPYLTLPCLAFPCLALPCLALPGRHHQFTQTSWWIIIWNIRRPAYCCTPFVGQIKFRFSFVDWQYQPIASLL